MQGDTLISEDSLIPLSRCLLHFSQRTFGHSFLLSSSAKFLLIDRLGWFKNSDALRFLEVHNGTAILVLMLRHNGIGFLKELEKELSIRTQRLPQHLGAPWTAKVFSAVAIRPASSIFSVFFSSESCA